MKNMFQISSYCILIVIMDIIFQVKSHTQINMEEYAREPCPWRIVDDCGGAFTMGAIGGAVFQAIKGFRNAPSGYSRRFQVRFCILLLFHTNMPFYYNIILFFKFILVI